MGSEHPHCDTLQNSMIILFFVAWVADSFFLGYSTLLVGLVPMSLRLLLAILSICTGAYLAAKSHAAIFSRVADEPRLVDSGVYSLVRHPMYLEILLFCLGFFFAIPSFFSLGILVVFFILYDRMAAYEENYLIELLKEEYLAYKKRVPRWLPRVRFGG